MSENKETNPLPLIFKATKEGKIVGELKSIRNIPLFFKYLSNKEISQEEKIEIINRFTEMIQENRYICEYFATNNENNKSIYIILFELYLLESSSDNLKNSIINLLKELIINVETNKNIYEFLFQKLSSIYRNQIEPSAENLNNILTLLNTVLGETDIQKPRNYFSCSGEGRFDVDLTNEKIELGTYLTFIINFKIASTGMTLGNSNISKLIKIDFSNGQSFSIILQDQMYLKIQGFDITFKVCAPNDWINLVVCIFNLNNQLDFYFFSNGENSYQSHKIIKTPKLRSDDCIESVIFFDNFYGEVTSMSMAVTKEANNWCMSNNFLKWFTNYKIGLWKKKYLDNFLNMLKQLVPTDSNYTKSRTVYFKTQEIKENPNFSGFKKNYADYLVFVYTPFNCPKFVDGEVENSLGKYKLNFNGNIRNHQYQCYQKKLTLVNGITNLIPLAELFLIRTKTLNEDNLELFLQIIINIINYRKYNIKTAKECNFFQILSLFIEKFPNYYFTEKIFEMFIKVGKTVFNNDEDICSDYFEHIFLNEKILSKYSENLQIKFWQQVTLFCQSDIDQIKNVMNINRICLILRFYDKNKYTEMCCENHLNEFKEEYIGSRTIMNPTMEKKLLNIEKSLIFYIRSKDSYIFPLFKLLTLDLSPCLTKFILKILSDQLGTPENDDAWKNRMIEDFINNKYETILINTFLHSLPDVRYEALNLMFQIHNLLNKSKKLKHFVTLEKMLKTCLLPKKMFYATYKESKTYLDEIKKKKKEEKMEERKQKNNTSLRKSSIVTHKYHKNLDSLNKKNQLDDVNENIKEENENVKEENENVKEENENIKIEIKKEEKNDKSEKKDDDIFGGEVKEEINNINIDENLKINEEKKKEENPDDDLDLEGNLNINEQIEKSTSTNQKDTKNQEKSDNQNMEEKVNSKKKLTQSTLTKPTFERFNSVVEMDMENLYEEKVENTINTIKTINKQIEKEIEKKEKEKEEEENQNFEEDSNAKKEIVIKDEVYKDYVTSLFEKIICWSYNSSLDVDLSYLNIGQLSIINFNILELVFILEKEYNDANLTIKIIESFKKMILHLDNCYHLLKHKKIYSLFMETTFKFYKKEEKEEKNIYELGKKVLLDIFINSFKYIEKGNDEKKKKNKEQKGQKNNENNKADEYPCFELESIFLWCNRMTKTNKNYSHNVNEFLNELLFEMMIQFKIYFEKKMNFKTNSDINSNFYLKNYCIMLTQLFRFSFHFQKFGENINDINLKSKIMEKYTSNMILDLTKDKINDIWLNFSFFDDIYKRLSHLWDKEHIYKKYKIQNKKVKILKYEEILENLILDKNNKNIFQSDLTFLSYEEKIKDTNTELIIPLIRTIPITLMSIITVLAKKGTNDKQLNYWIKEYKKFIRFIIISSTNLTRINQQDLYNNIQEKCIGVIITSICFLKDLLNTSRICKEKIQKSLYSILLYCFIITKYQYKYINKHKSGLKFFNIAAKPARNDLKLSAIFLLFSDIIKDKNGNVILTLEKLEQLSVNQYVNIINLLDKQEWDEALFNNQNLKDKILNKFFTFVNFQNTEGQRNDLIKEMNDDVDEKYTEEVLNILPLYERELSKSSNSSLENTIQKKNRYKAIKKKSFSWGGFWSDKKLFFENVDKLKLKLINHYTKTFMKPILTPILDIEYYLPEFSGFKISTLFRNNEENDDKFKITMDIDKILRLSEQNQIAMNNIKESFGEKKSKVRENYLRKIYLKSNEKLAQSLKKIANSLDFGKEEEFTNLDHSNEKNDNNTSNNAKSKYFLSCLVKTSHHIKGVCFIDEKQLNFKVFLNQRTGNSMSGVELAFTKEDDDYDQDRQTCFGSYFVCHPKDKDLYQITIDYNDIKWIFRRRYYYKNSAIEIFTTTNKSFYLNFKYEQDREIVINEIVNKIKETSKLYADMKDPKDNFDNIIGFENMDAIHSKKKTKKTKLSKKIEMWKNWEINNFEFLMWLNIYGNRSYNDISQYPVFPWVLSNYEDPLKTVKENTKKKKQKKNINATLNDSDSDEEDDNENDTDKLDYNYRDLNLPMGMLELNEEGEKRTLLFMETYETLKNDPDNEIKPYIYGSNYSNPMYVCNFMTRLFPFTHISIELQGNKFDNPDRLFLSVKNSFYNSTTQKTDVRELIPEFFYLPEMFLNINELNLGSLENGTIVDDVLTPCDNNPYDFIITMKNVLESDKLSNTLQNWVDLIFGYKARGKEAEAAHNLFTEASYQENINIEKVENKESMLRQVEFGLIPTQILNKECGKRLKKEDIMKGKEITDSTCELGLNKCKKHSESQSNKKDKKDKKDKNKEVVKNNENKEDYSILCVGSFAPEKLSIICNNDVFIEKKISCPVFDKIYTDEQINRINLEKQYNKMSEFYSNDSINNKTISFFQHGKIIIMGGFYDGKVLLTSVEGKRSPIIITPFKDESPILAITCDKEDDFIFMGSAVGNVGVFKNFEGNLKSKYLLSDQSSPISHIHCSDELNLLSTASINGNICLYTLPLCKLVRCLKVPTDNCSYVFLSDSPLPSIIVITDDESNSIIYSYSINGKFYNKKEEYFKISNPILIKDLDSNDYLVCIGNDNIYIISLPDLVVHVTIEKVYGVHSICFSEDNKILYALNKKGTEVTVIKEEKPKFYRSASFMWKKD